jgi:hypothetical protein
MKRRIKLENVGDKYYRKDGEQTTEIIDGKSYTGIIRKEHPSFDISLVRGEHYYGQIDYYLEVE